MTRFNFLACHNSRVTQITSRKQSFFILSAALCHEITIIYNFSNCYRHAPYGQGHYYTWGDWMKQHKLHPYGCFDRSSMYTLNKIGGRMAPWQTPSLKWNVANIILSHLIHIYFGTSSKSIQEVLWYVQRIWTHNTLRCLVTFQSQTDY